MRRHIRLAICPLWDPSLAELTERARHRSTLARIELADRAIEREWHARVERNRMRRMLRECWRFVGQMRA